MIATTYGLGPFQPAISFNGRLWLLSADYANEDEAQAVSQKVLDRILASATEVLNHSSFYPTKIK